MDNACGLKLENVTADLKIYQKSGVFCYGTDAVILAKYVRGAEKYFSSKKMLDLCSGTGIIPLMLLSLEPKLSFAHAIEINSEAVSLSVMSAKESGLDGRFECICDNLKNIKQHFSDGVYDFLTCNPPYMSNTSGKLCNQDYKTIARHEIECTLNDIFSAAFYLLKTGGSFYVVYRPDRLSYLFECAHNNRFEIKNMTFVHSKIDKEPCLVVCEAKKQAKSGICISKPFVIYDSDGKYSQQMEQSIQNNIIIV